LPIFGENIGVFLSIFLKLAVFKLKTPIFSQKISSKSKLSVPVHDTVSVATIICRNLNSRITFLGRHHSFQSDEISSQTAASNGKWLRFFRKTLLCFDMICIDCVLKKEK
jgi:hypothetical protein